jgi:hypothetical protein
MLTAPPPPPPPPHTHTHTHTCTHHSTRSHALLSPCNCIASVCPIRHDQVPLASCGIQVIRRRRRRGACEGTPLHNAMRATAATRRKAHSRCCRCPCGRARSRRGALTSTSLSLAERCVRMSSTILLLRSPRGHCHLHFEVLCILHGCIQSIDSIAVLRGRGCVSGTSCEY